MTDTTSAMREALVKARGYVQIAADDFVCRSSGMRARDRALLVEIDAALTAPAQAPEKKLGDDICMNGRLFLRELAETMGVIDVCADPNEVIPISEVMPKMLARAREDRERWHTAPAQADIHAPWLYIVHCPTDNSEWQMRLDDGTEFYGRWSSSQKCWQRSSEPYEINDLHMGKGEGRIWSNLPKGVYPVAYRAQADIHATMETAVIISWLGERQRVLKQWLGDNPDVKMLVVSRSEIRSEIAKLGLFSKAIAHSHTPPRVDEKEMLAVPVQTLINLVRDYDNYMADWGGMDGKALRELVAFGRAMMEKCR